MHSVDVFRNLQPEVTMWRRHLHENPELDFQVHETAAFVAKQLSSFGITRIVTGIAGTGLVALIRGKLGEGPTIALRADMDGLPIVEKSSKPWISKVTGKMHACGHDGHTAMLLGAAKYLAATRNFRGTIALIFQPAEEDGLDGETGAQRMVREGVLDRFDISEIYGMHNLPGMGIGQFGIRAGSILASQDDFDIVVKGKGGHAATPHQAVDPVVIAAQIVSAIQILVSRNVDARQALVISVTRLAAGQAYNVIPHSASMAGTVRTLVPELRDFAEKQIEAIAQGIARGFGADIEFRYNRAVPVTNNYTEQTIFARSAAIGLVGLENVDLDIMAIMGAEDFAYFSEKRPAAFIFVGNGNTPGLHHPEYDFNDEVLPYGIGYWVNLAEYILAA